MKQAMFYSILSYLCMYFNPIMSLDSNSGQCFIQTGRNRNI